MNAQQRCHCHRYCTLVLSAIKYADQIVALDSENVVEIGFHNSLMQGGGFYAKHDELESFECKQVNVFLAEQAPVAFRNRTLSDARLDQP
jgi:hypothetical protein